MWNMKGTAMVKSRDRYKKLLKVFPERSEHYLAQIEMLDRQIGLAKVCRRCGRPLSDENAMELGYGKECAAKAEAEASEEEWDASSDSQGSLNLERTPPLDSSSTEAGPA